MPILNAATARARVAPRVDGVAARAMGQARAAGMPLGTVLGAGPAPHSVGQQTISEAGWQPPTVGVARSPAEAAFWATTFPVPPRAGAAPGWPLPPQPPLARPRTAAIDDIDEP